jgi:hypothetical protein
LTPYVAYLRVYEPLSALPGPVVTAWQSAPEAPETDPVAGPAVERERALRGLLAIPPVAVPAHDGAEAFVLELDEQVYLCPWETRLRCWIALEELRNTVPEPVLDAFLPRVVVDAADIDFARWRAEHPGASPHILTSPWQVPLRWFVAFSSTELIAERAPGAAEGDPARRLYYRTPMVNARRRVARGLQVLRRMFDSSPLSDGVEELGRWLEAFHPRAYVELDFGGLPRLPVEPPLAADTSAGDVQRALASLAAGDSEAAVHSYRDLVNRWRLIGEFANAS